MATRPATRTTPAKYGKYDPKRAAQLLDEAGWKADGEVRKKDGRTLEIRFVIPSAVATSKQEAELIQDMLNQIGVALIIVVVPSPDLFDNYVRPGQFDMTVFSWMGTPFPISSASRSTCSRPGSRRRARHPSEFRAGRLRRARPVAGPGQRRSSIGRTAIELANRADEQVWEEGHSLTIYQGPESWWRSAMANVGAFGFAERDLRGHRLGETLGLLDRDDDHVRRLAAGVLG